MSVPIYINPSNGVQVFLCRRADGTEVVVKEVERPSDTSLAAVCAEGEIAKSLTHPNICKVFSWKTEYREGSCFLRIEMEKGDSDLGHELSKRGEAWTEEEVWNMLCQTVAGFCYAQRHNICHRDIKPQNILIQSNGRVIISDFGTAKLVTMSGLSHHTLQGTPNYLSPELFLYYQKLMSGEFVGKPVHDPYLSDVYSLGLSFIEMIRLQFPMEMRNLIHTAEMTERVLARLNCSEELKVLLGSMVEPEAGYRPNFLQLASMLENIRNCNLDSVVPLKSNYSRSIRRTIAVAPAVPTILLTLATFCNLCRRPLELEHIGLECGHQFCLSVGCLETLSQTRCPVCSQASCLTLHETCIECRKRLATWHHSECGRGYCQVCVSSWTRLSYSPKCIICKKPLVSEEEQTLTG